MNFLAHFYLSDDGPAALVGGLMGDFVKGRLQGRFAHAVERAIVLHRQIDTFTDADPTVRRSRRRIANDYRLLQPVLVDVFYDHFLARDWWRYSAEPFESFKVRVYEALRGQRHLFPPVLDSVAMRMATEDWLQAYGTLEGIETALRRMSRRLSRPNRLGDGGAQLVAHYDRLRADFHDFMPRLERYARRLRAAWRGISESHPNDA